MRIIKAIVLLLCVSTVALADLKVTTKNAGGGGTSQSTVYIKGTRQRTESPGAVSILQCDLRRSIQFNDKTRKYLVMPLDGGGESGGATTQTAAPAGQQQQSRRGAVVTQTLNILDTGERKPMFGYTARHIKATTVMDAPPESCNPGRIQIESDGWYIDLPMGFSCGNDRPVMPAPRVGAQPACRDEVRYKRTGTGKLGFAVLLTTKITTGGQGGDAETSAMMSQPMTNTQEVTDISNVALDAALFDIPAGYTEAASFEELYAPPGGMVGMNGMSAGGQMPAAAGEGGITPTAPTVRAKPPGTIRVGVAAIDSGEGRDLPLESLRARLVGSISGAGLEAIALDASGVPAAEAEAKQKDCDLVLYTSLSALKQSAASKIGGMFGRAAGVSTPGAERFESRVDFRLYAVGGSVQLESNATAKEEGAEASVTAALEREAKAVVAAARKKKN
jgi:hypothetical protein